MIGSDITEPRLDVIVNAAHRSSTPRTSARRLLCLSA